MTEHYCNRDERTYTSSFREGLRLALRHTAVEAARDVDQLWNGHYNSDVAAYNHEFHPLRTQTIEDFLWDRKLETGAAYAMDFMGTLDFSAVAPVDGQAYMTLVQKLPSRGEQEVIFDGTALLFGPWLQAHTYIETVDTKRPNPGFDLITGRPLNGYVGLADVGIPERHRHLLMAALVQREVNLLATGGRLRQQLPFFFDYRAWAEDLNNTPGISAEAEIFHSQKGYHRTVIEVERHRNGKLWIPRPRGVIKFEKPQIHMPAST